jgi:uncharacterized membrane protein
MTREDESPRLPPSVSSLAAPARERVVEIDIGRGLAVLLMVLVHTLWMYGSKETQSSSLLGHMVHFVGKGTAAFLLAMGLSFTLARRGSLQGDLLRALLILGVGYGTNFLKFIVPISLFGTMPESFIAAYGWRSPLGAAELRYLLLTGDILQMAGVSLLLIALLRHHVRSKWLVLSLAVLVLGLSRELSGLRPGMPVLDYVADLFVANHYHVYFPVLPWMSFILVGLAMGMDIRDRGFDHRPVFAAALPAGIACVALGGALCVGSSAYHWGSFFHLGPGGAVYLLGINLVLLHVIHRIVERRKRRRGAAAAPGAWMKLLTYSSARVTSLYVIQWTLIAWGMGVVGFQTLTPGQTAAMMPVALLATFAVRLAWDQLATKLASPARPLDLSAPRRFARSRQEARPRPGAR